ncbi:RnfABCDGE type electron transport complex subunit D [Anoxynatronum buryatiense]|uniref:Electron transport complex protein RnfD n=1 Tax=Anoxynatronum buryatiense TaxID=489973 RepID=A0AA45WU12_9CLOT|nr:RnfABCDGE type electron transport complex subunit D [Anoxynatronum buryatiense]SMP44963.1 electron transport complex protein RnfD [Anoxynatronum buryatiense]
MEQQRLVITPAPHLKSGESVGKAMRDTMIALVPVTLVAVYFFKAYAIFLIVVCMGTAALTEIAFRRFKHQPHRLRDGSALLTGLFVALCYSATTAWWKGALATFIAVGVAKELMGGLGWNRFNPALFGRVAMILLGPWFVDIGTEFMRWNVNFGPVDVMTHATPLAMLHQGLEMPAVGSLFLGFPGGAMGEVSPLALLIGGGYLLYRGHINWRIPGSILCTVFVLAAITGQNPFLHLVTGGLMLGAFFMATDWVTSPITEKGKVVFGVAIGVLIVVFRIGLAPTEGVAFSILIMNAFVPTIEKMTRRLPFSEPRKTAARHITLPESNI